MDNRTLERIAPQDSSDPACRCSECGMETHDACEYHPYAACLMYKACGDRSTVLANLNAVLAMGRLSVSASSNDQHRPSILDRPADAPTK